jgi:hypothetical protein
MRGGGSNRIKMNSPLYFLQRRMRREPILIGRAVTELFLENLLADFARLMGLPHTRGSQRLGDRPRGLARDPALRGRRSTRQKTDNPGRAGL